jgi:hypothetical protein
VNFSRSKKSLAIRGRPPLYQTDEERAQARRESSRNYRKRKADALAKALKRIEELEVELELYKEANGIKRTESDPDTAEQQEEL